MQNYFGCHISCGYSARTQIRDTYTQLVHEIPSEAITLNTLQGFRTGGMIVLPFPKYDIMLIVLVVVEPLLPQAIPVRFSDQLWPRFRFVNGDATESFRGQSVVWK
jgi:hypothetical protein